MRTSTARGLATLSLTLLALSACSGDGGSGGDSSGRYGGGEQEQEDAKAGASDGESMTDGAQSTSLATADTDLGTIVVDGTGMVVYQFDQDEQGSGSSTCTDQCAENWPAVPGSAAPELDGVTGEVGTITGVDGQPQLTLDGWPLYYFVGDQEPGDTTGQGVNEVWWVLAPDGEVIRG